MCCVYRLVETFSPIFISLSISIYIETWYFSNFNIYPITASKYSLHHWYKIYSLLATSILKMFRQNDHVFFSYIFYNMCSTFQCVITSSHLLQTCTYIRYFYPKCLTLFRNHLWIRREKKYPWFKVSSEKRKPKKNFCSFEKWKGKRKKKEL